MICPACACVRSLYCLQKSMMFSEYGPSAGPTGGAGVALPAGKANPILPTTFFAIFLLTNRLRGSAPLVGPAAGSPSGSVRQAAQPEDYTTSSPSMVTAVA